MLREKMAMALTTIAQYQEQFDIAGVQLNAIAANVPRTSGWVIDDQELQEAFRYESQLVELTKDLEKKRKQLEAAKMQFLDVVPDLVLNQMRNDGKAVYASWVSQDQRQTHYGPYAAYFADNQLLVVPFKDFHKFKADYERFRNN